MYDDVKQRLQVEARFNLAYEGLCGEDGRIEKTSLGALVNETLYPAETLGCSHEERLKIRNKITALFSHFYTLTVVCALL